MTIKMKNFSVFLEAAMQVERDDVNGILIPPATVDALLSRPGAPKATRGYSDIMRLTDVVDQTGGGGAPPGGPDDPSAPPPSILDPKLDTRAKQAIVPDGQGGESQEGEGEGEPDEPDDSDGTEGESGEGQPGESGEGESGEGQEGEGQPGEPGEGGDGQISDNGEGQENASPGDTAGGGQQTPGQTVQKLDVTPNADGTYTDQDGVQHTADELRDLINQGAQVSGISKLPEAPVDVSAEDIKQQTAAKAAAAREASGQEAEVVDQSATDADLAKQIKKTGGSNIDSQQDREQYNRQVEKARDQIVVDPDLTREYWDKVAKDVIDITRKEHHKSGSESSDERLQDKMIERLRSKINWKDALKNIFKEKGSTFYDITRPSRRSQAIRSYEPRRTKRMDKASQIVIAVDTSGSCMQGDIYSKFMSEVLGLFDKIPNIEAFVALYTVTVYEFIKVNKNNKFALLNIKPKSGSNDMDVVPEYLELMEKKVKPKMVIYFTDGEEDLPHLPRTINGKKVEYVFFLTPGGDYNTVAPFGKVYRLTE